MVAQGCAAFPRSAALANSAGNIALRAGDTVAAERYFARALELAPRHLEYALNRAIVLSKMNRYREARAQFEAYEGQGRNVPRYCSARAACERASGNLREAEQWYDLCLSFEPRHFRALHGRARVALEQGESSALERFDRALRAHPDDPHLWLGKAQALDVAGESAQAREIAEALCRQAPHWLDGLRFLAQLRLAAGESDWTSHYARAARAAPADFEIPAAHAALLAGLDRHGEAAGVIGEARARFPERPHFALLEAVYSGASGDDGRAEAIFARLELATAERHLQEARHRIRRRQPEAAAALLEHVLEEEPWNIGGWALRGLVWRMAGDVRADWLHGQAGLVALVPLADFEMVVPPAIPLLHRLHDRSAFPLGQSLRGGSQTRGVLFHRKDPELSALHAAIDKTVKAYRAALPAPDPSHPLLRHRNLPWRLEGSWSVRLAGGDFHASHIHPEGIVSSALYLELPETGGNANSHAGWLEIGRPPADLRLDLPPLRTIEPRAGHLALFPSTLYHGTVPFESARRLTVAFDLAPQNEGSR